MAMGGDPLTFAGLAGMGDLVATCVSPQSRNRHVGEQLGKGRTIDEIIDEMNMVAEGVKTVAVVHGAGRRVRRRDADRRARCTASSTRASPATEAYRGLLGRQRATRDARPRRPFMSRRASRSRPGGSSGNSIPTVPTSNRARRRATSPIATWMQLGTVSTPERAHRRPARLVHGEPTAGWSLDWWIGADDRWHIPSREVAVRQQRLDASPVIETAMRIPGGDAVHRAYAVQEREPGRWSIVEIENRTSIPFAVALTIVPYNAARRGRRADDHVTRDDRRCRRRARIVLAQGPGPRRGRM